MWLGISEIRDGGAQMRAQMNEEHIERLVEALQSGAELPPIVVFHYTGEEAYWLADGYHRYAERRKLLLAEAARAAGVRAWRDVRDLAYQQRAAALLQQAATCVDDSERHRLLGLARLELACVHDQTSDAWRDLDRRQLELRSNPPQARRADETPARLVTPAPGERPEITEIRRRAAALGYHTALTGAPGQDHILIWRTGERLSDLDGLPLDEARTWLDEREAEARAWLEERKAEAEAGSDLAAYQERVGALLAAADLRLVRVLGVIFGEGEGDETDIDYIAQEMVYSALQTNPDRLYRVLAQVR